MQFTKEEYQKIINLLLSFEEANTSIAVQFLSSVDLVPEMITVIMWISFHQTSSIALSNTLDLLLEKGFTKEEVMSKRSYAYKLFKIRHNIVTSGLEISYRIDDKGLKELLSLYPKIQKEVEKLLAFHPYFFQEYKAFAQIIWDHYRFIEAEDFLAKVLQFEPQNADFHFFLAQVYQSKQDFGQAVKYYETFLTLAPAHLPNNEFMIIEWVIQLKNYPPSTVSALAELGTIYENQYQDLTKAESYYRQAIGLQAFNHQLPLDKLADLLEKKGGDWREILALRVRACEIFQNSKANILSHKELAQRYAQIAKAYEEKLNDIPLSLVYHKKSLFLNSKREIPSGIKH
ncbi:MAG: hypothetical protein MUE85_17620 [Microscillaceae bacterium]|jgi:tetratricopeptide (TPR) repeat protein|nr:hypothetical protein [Microscillaceae bacterium]